MTDTTSKLRALFLTALMVFSVFAGTVAFSGAAAAAANAGNTGVDDPVFQGESLTVATGEDYSTMSGDGPVTIEENDLVQLRRGILGDEDSERVAVGEAGGDVTFTGDQMDVEPGYYFLRANGENLEGTQFEIVEQDFDVSFEADPTYEEGDTGSTELNVTSANFFEQEDRDNFDVTVNSTSIEGEELVDLFGTDATDVKSDDPVTLTVDGDNKDVWDLFGVDFGNTDLDYGTYNFTVESQTSSASAEVSVSYEEQPETDVGIEQTSYQNEAGDVVDFNVSITEGDTGYVSIAASGLDYDIKVTDDNEDGVVGVQLNTYNADVSPENDDDSASVENDDGANQLKSGTFEMEAAATVDGTATDVATLQLSEPSLDGASVHVAPGSPSDYDSVSAIEGNVTERSEVALGEEYADTVIVAYDVSGVFGAIDAKDAVGEPDDLLTWEVRENVNYGPTEIEGADVFTDDENNRIYWVLEDLSANDPAVATGDSFTANFSISDKYEYWDEAEEVTTDFELVDATASPSVVEAPYQVLAQEDSEIRGTSTVAPGTTFNVRAVGAGAFLQVAEDVEVAEDGTWTATYDFSDRSVGTNFTVSVTPTYGEEVDAVFSDTPEWETTQTDEQLEQRIDELNTLLNETMDELNATENTVEEQASMLEDKNATIDEQQTTISGLEDEVSSLEDEVASLEDERDTLQNEVASLEDEVSNYESQVSSLEDEVSNYESQVSSLEDEVSNYESQVSSLQSTLEDKNSTISGLEDEVSSLEDEVSSLEEEAETTTTSGPGFTAVLALVALMGAALLAVRRQQ